MKMSSSEKKIKRLTKIIETQVKTIEAMSNELSLLREQALLLQENYRKNHLQKRSVIINK